jgi:hypothetical protein
LRFSRWQWIGAIALITLVLLTVFAAPFSPNRRAGSTYSRAPDGYGAWYAYMQAQQICVQRWQYPFSTLNASGTFLRVNSDVSSSWIGYDEQQWVEKGNTFVVLGYSADITEAPFTTTQSSDQAGAIKIETRRRRKFLAPSATLKTVLGDRFGAMVWNETRGKGEVIVAVTPHLAANAYQDSRDNYQLLKNLVTTKGGKIWVDEYNHGYQNQPAPPNSACPSPVITQPAQAARKRQEGDAFTYLAKTPWVLIVAQTLILLVLWIWSHNRRFGLPQSLPQPVVDNSTAYIHALATVLQKAESSSFVVEIIGKAEQLRLQRCLGLGETTLLDTPTLSKAWEQQTGRTASALKPLLKPPMKRHLSDQDLLLWLQQWRTLQAQVWGDRAGPTSP